MTVSRDNDDSLSGDNDEVKFILFLNQLLYLSSFSIKCWVCGQSVFLKSISTGICFRKCCVCPHSQSSVEIDLLPNQESRLSSFLIEWQDCPLLQSSVEIVLLLHHVNSDVSSYGDKNVSLSGDNDSE